MLCNVLSSCFDFDLRCGHLRPWMIKVILHAIYCCFFLSLPHELPYLAICLLVKYLPVLFQMIIYDYIMLLQKDWLWVIVAVAEWCINIVVFISLEDCGYFYRFYRRCQVQFWSGRAWLYPLWRSHLHRRCPRFMERCRICQDSVQLVNTTPISLWFMALITFYNYSFWGL